MSLLINRENNISQSCTPHFLLNIIILLIYQLLNINYFEKEIYTYVAYHYFILPFSHFHILNFDTSYKFNADPVLLLI